LIKSWTFL